MGYQFLVDTYETERMKTLSTWSTFKDEDMKGVRIRKTDGEGMPMSIWFTNASEKIRGFVICSGLT
jgi:hypothetical protein